MLSASVEAWTMSQRTSSFAKTNKNETKTKTKVVAYNLEQLKGALEVGPIVLLVHLSSTRCLSGVPAFAPRSATQMCRVK
jgi:hypothetical protein